MALTKVGYHQISSHPETMPTQTSNSGKFLSTDGSNTSWGTVSTGVAGIVSSADASASFHSVLTLSALSIKPKLLCALLIEADAAVNTHIQA